MRYRRAQIPGGIYFLTWVLEDRSTALLTEHIDALRNAFRTVRSKHPFDVESIVVLPDHLHAIWSLPSNDNSLATRVRLIKSSFSRMLVSGERVSSSRRRKSERGIWQRRYWEHVMRDAEDYAKHVDYIHFNPLKHGYVTRPVDWVFSSIHRYIKLGILDADWAANYSVDEDGGYGDVQ